MENGLCLFLSVLSICISIITVKNEVFELQEQNEQLKNEIIELKEVINNTDLKLLFRG